MTEEENRTLHAKPAVPGRARRNRLAWLSMVAVLAGSVAAMWVSASSALAAAAPAWSLQSVSVPTRFQPGSTGDQYVVTATNIGAVSASSGAVVTLTPPAGVEVTGLSGKEGSFTAMTCVLAELKCTTTGTLATLEAATVTATVSVVKGAAESVTLGARIAGGGALQAAALGDGNDPVQPTLISSTPASFGIASFNAEVLNEDGTIDATAGSHPWGALTSFTLNSATMPPFSARAPYGNVKDVNVELPAGFVGNPNATPRCPEEDFTAPDASFAASCASDTQVGEGTTVIGLFGTPDTVTSPIYNLQPPPGVPAEFGFYVLTVPVRIFVHVRSNGDYGLTTSLKDISTSAEIMSSTLLLWGNPAQASHNAQRGSAYGGPAIAFLTNPVSCEGGPLRTRISADSWQHPSQWSTSSVSTATAPAGCEALRLQPALSVSTDESRADSPSGLAVTLKIKQDEGPLGVASPELRDAAVELPAGLSLSPALTAGLTGCDPQQSGIGREGPIDCPPTSQVGTATIDSPLLPGPLAGGVYVGSQASPDPNPYTIYLLTEGYGVTVRLKGTVAANPSTGQLTATFDGNPQMPVSQLTLRFPGGQSAAFATPSRCGSYAAKARLLSWSGQSAEAPSVPFAVTQAAAGGACPAAAPFAPRFRAGTLSNRAGGPSAFTLTISRSDGEGTLHAVNVRLPSGLLGMISHVTPCPAAQAVAGACAASSLIGQSTITAGAGLTPLTVSGGKVYLTGPSGGAPYGLSIVVPAIAGPFRLGTVTVHAAIHVDPRTAAISIDSEPLPSILGGVPLDVRTLNITIDRGGFMRNPTSCAPTSIQASISAVSGAVERAGSRFQAADCAALPFKPRLGALVVPRSSRRAGVSMRVVMRSGPRQASIKSVFVKLPRALSVRESTLKRACPEAVFDANPSRCDAKSRVASATVYTPVLPSPLHGPAYFVSQGSAGYPRLVAVLRGDGIVVEIQGRTRIVGRSGITVARFGHLPDVPITRFDLVMPSGPNSVLAAAGRICGRSLTMPVAITGQNGAIRRSRTRIRTMGCATSRSAHPRRARARHASARSRRRHRRAG